MGNKLCCEGILQNNTEHSYVIYERQYEQSNKLMNEHLGSKGMDFITKNNLPLWKMKDQEKYFCGNFRQGKAHGLGLLFIPNRSYYEGQLENGLPDGHGFLKNYFKDNIYQIYQGQFFKGMAHGKGHLQCRHNKMHFQFLGEWQNSYPKQGTVKPKFDSQVESIEIKNQIKIIKFKNGNIYEGSVNPYFEPNGRGKLVYNNSSRAEFYEGQWLNGKFNGNGIFKWKDGSSYEGQYIHGEKQGEGKFIFASKNYYKGHWLEGNQHGIGCLYKKDGQQLQKGIWIKGKLQVQIDTNLTTQEKNLKHQLLPSIIENHQKSHLKSDQI